MVGDKNLIALIEFKGTQDGIDTGCSVLDKGQIFRIAVEHRCE